MRVEPADPKKMDSLSRFLFRQERKVYGEELIETRVWARRPSAFVGMTFLLAGAFGRFSTLDRVTRGLVLLRTSQINGCLFCMDCTAFLLLKEVEGNEAFVEALPKAKGNPLFSEAQQVAIEYVEQVVSHDKSVTDELFARLKEHYSEEQIVELTMLASLESAVNMINTALEVPSQGLCRVPGQ